MKRIKITYIVGICICLVFFSCNSGETINPDGTRVVKEYHKGKILKSEITLKDSLRHGVTKNYDSHGNIMSMAHFVNNKKEGVAINYYPSGKINQEMVYKNNLLEGEAKMYYKTGKLYMVTHYLNNKKHGLEQTYYENGKLQSEVEYYKGGAGIGLKEYNDRGVLITKKPSILVREINPPFENKLILEVSLSDNTRSVDFYLDTLVLGKYTHKYMYQIETGGGIGRIEFFKSNTIQMKKLNIIAEIKTARRNKQILQRSYNLVIN